MRADELDYTIKPQPLDRGHPQPPPAVERGVSQQPVPPPEGPLVGDVTMHTDPDVEDGGRIAIWVGVIVIVFLILILAVVTGIVLR
jgi:hypothetical protein